MGETTAEKGATGGVPAHVPPELVMACDFYSDPGFTHDPFRTVAWQTTGPRIFYSPAQGMFPGSWVLTRNEDIRFVLFNPELFSTRGEASFSALIGESWYLVPVELEPPDHARFRKLLGPRFSAKAVETLAGGIQSAANSLIDAFAGSRSVEFMSAFARPFPATVLSQLLGLPAELVPELLQWEAGLLKSFSLDERRDAAHKVIGCLRRAMRQRRSQPDDDFISWAVQARIDGRAVSDDEIIGMCLMLFVAGIDTVASTLGFHCHHLAAHPELQAELRADRSRIATAVEELLRLYSIVIDSRRVMKDTEIAGVQLRRGDWISAPTFHASRDPAVFESPHDFILDRDQNHHAAFSYGPHHCLGAHLARRQIAVALNALFDRLPPLRLRDSAPLRTFGGEVFGVAELHLDFSP